MCRRRILYEKQATAASMVVRGFARRKKKLLTRYDYSRTKFVSKMMNILCSSWSICTALAQRWRRPWRWHHRMPPNLRNWYINASNQQARFSMWASNCGQKIWFHRIWCATQAQARRCRRVWTCRSTSSLPAEKTTGRVSREDNDA